MADSTEQPARFAGLKYGQIKRTHQEYDEKHWLRCEALYAGGKKLLCNPAAMEELFPKHAGETDTVYEERKKRAFIIPYAGHIVDRIVAGVFSDDFSVELDGEPLAEDSFWDQFVKDVSPAGGTTQSLRQLLRDQLLTALIKQRAWTLVELPRRDPDAEYPTRADEEKAGQLDAYAVPIDPACVRNWRLDERGEIVWALVRYVDDVPLDIDQPGGMVRVEYTRYDQDGWTRWKFEHPVGKEPQDTALMIRIPGIDITSGPLSFTRVPLRRFELPDGLYAMGKLWSMAREHFNKLNAKSWGEYRGLFQFLAAFLQEPDPGNAITEDQNRDINQPIGPGRIMRLAEKDRLEMISPQTAPFEIAGTSLASLRDEMYRVTEQMAQGIDQGSVAALNRSGESKKEDKKGEALVYLALGERACEHAVDVLDTAAMGRGEKDQKFAAVGLDSYEDVSLGALVEQETLVQTIPVPSETFHVERFFDFCRRYLGKRATPKLMEEIRGQLERNLPPEQFEPIPPVDPNAPPAGDPNAEDGDELDGEPVDPPAKAGKKPGLSYNSPGM